MVAILIIAFLFYIAMEENEKKSKKFNNFTGKWEYPVPEDVHKYDVYGPF